MNLLKIGDKFFWPAFELVFCEIYKKIDHFFQKFGRPVAVEN